MGVAAALALGLVQGTSNAEDPDLSWPPATPGAGYIGFILEDAWLLNSNIRVPTPGWQPSCTTMDDPACASPAEEYGWWIERVAPPCTQALPWEECVDTLSLTLPGTGTRALTWTGLAPGRSFPPDANRGMPTGSTVSLYDDPDSTEPNVGYAVYLGGQMSGREGPFGFGEFAAQVIRYREVPVGQQPGAGRCLWYGAGTCAYRLPFEEKSKITLSVRMSERMTGWLGGRLEDPSIDVTPLGKGLNRLTVTALPVDVPLVAAQMPTRQATPEILDFWREAFTCPGPKPCEEGVTSGQSSGIHGPDLLRLFQDFLGDTATQSIPTWSLVSLPKPARGACLEDTSRLVGLVTTNATVYDGNPPALVDGALAYRVAALHNVPGGQPLSGTYDLVLRSDAARCLYGLSKAPIKAEIQVTSEDGADQVATTAVSEKGGWLHLAAYGFSFSQPTISARLTGKQASTTIMCRKGKKTKKIKGVAPKCPKGWRLVKAS